MFIKNTHFILLSRNVVIRKKSKKIFFHIESRYHVFKKGSIHTLEPKCSNPKKIEKNIFSYRVQIPCF